MTFDRNDFPMLRKQGLVYLDSAATSLKPSCVIDTMSEFYRTSYATVHRTAYSLSLEATQRYSQVREKARAFINASSTDEIIFTRGTTEGLNLIAHCYPIKAGDEIIISGQEHHSNIVPWQLLCERLGAHLKVIPLHPDGQINLAKFHALLTPRTKLISIVHVSNVLGIVNPVEEIIAAAHAIGAHVVLDAAQSAVHLPIDVQSLCCDFLVFSSHKIYGPTGVGILYGKKSLLQMMPPYQGGGDMIQTVTFEKTTYQEPPLRFEAGTPMIAEVIGLGAALDYITSQSRQALVEHEKTLIDLALQNLPPEAQILGPRENRTSLITFQIPGAHPLDLATLLDLQGIAVRSGHLCAQPLMRHFGLTSALRLSIAPYNTAEEILYFCEALKKVVSKLRSTPEMSIKISI
jgi:cysteine desulfurase / selenocysteine lyase